MDLSELWDGVIFRLQQDHNLPRFSTAFVYLARPAGRTEQHLIIEAPSNMVRDHLETHVRDALTQAVADVTGQKLNLLFDVNPELEDMPLQSVE